MDNTYIGLLQSLFNLNHGLSTLTVTAMFYGVELSRQSEI